MAKDPRNIKCSDCVHYAHVVNMMLTGDMSYRICVDCCMLNSPVGKHYEEKKESKK